MILGDCIIPKNMTMDKDGYPRVKFYGKPWRMNRWMWTKVNGEIPSGLVVAHACNNTSCINPHHFYLTTSEQNSTDAAKDGLYATEEKHPKFKKHLNTEELYKRYLEGESQQSIAKSVGIAQSSLSQRFITYRRKNNL